MDKNGLQFWFLFYFGYRLDGKIKKTKTNPFGGAIVMTHQQ
jgi:hypothetical protein